MDAEKENAAEQIISQEVNAVASDPAPTPIANIAKPSARINRNILAGNGKDYNKLRTSFLAAMGITPLQLKFLDFWTDAGHLV